MKKQTERQNERAYWDEHGIDEVDGQDVEVEVAEELGQEWRCGCRFCYCSDRTADGGPCDSCLAGAHQG